MNTEATTNGGKRYTTGTLNFEGKGQTFAQAVGLGDDLDAAIAKSKESNNATYGKITGTTVDVEIKYYVEPAPQGQNRSGKVVVEYRLIVKFTGTRRGTGAAFDIVGTTVSGNGWFQDDGLKTTELFDR